MVRLMEVVRRPSEERAINFIVAIELCLA